MESLSPERLPGHPHQVTVPSQWPTIRESLGSTSLLYLKRGWHLSPCGLREREVVFGRMEWVGGKQHPQKWGPGDHETAPAHHRDMQTAFSSGVLPQGCHFCSLPEDTHQAHSPLYSPP